MGAVYWGCWAASNCGILSKEFVELLCFIGRPVAVGLMMLQANGERS
jgi:hypothetical protein